MFTWCRYKQNITNGTITNNSLHFICLCDKIKVNKIIFLCKENYYLRHEIICVYGLSLLSLNFHHLLTLAFIHDLSQC